MGEKMKKIISILLILLCSGSFLFSQSVKSKSGELLLNRLKDGNIEVETPFIKAVFSPRDGGKIISLINKKNLEEIVYYNTNLLESSGLCGDNFDILWPGDETKPYSIRATALTKDESGVLLEFTGSVKDFISSKDIALRKRYTLFKNYPLISIEVELVNNSSKDVSLIYGMKNFFQTESNSYSRSVLTSIDNEIEEIPFFPLSGEHGDTITPDADFIVLKSKETTKSLALILFDRENIFFADSCHNLDNLSIELYFKQMILSPKKPRLIKFDLLLLDEIQSITAANFNNNILADIRSEIKTGRLFVNSKFFKYGEEINNLNVKVLLLDENEKPIATLKEEKIDKLSFSTPFELNTSMEISRIKNPFVKLFVQITDSSENTVFSSMQKIKISGEPSPLSTKNKLTLDIVWHFNQPYFEDMKVNSDNLQKYLKSYSNVISFIEKKPKIKSDMVISGMLLYNLVQNQPEFIEKVKDLINKKQLNLLATGFSYSPFNIISPRDIEIQIQMDRELKFSLFGIKPEGIYFPDLAFNNTTLEPVVKNQITVCYFSDSSIFSGYKDFPGMNYHVPSRVISKGLGLNALIVDTKARQIIKRKSERAINDFINYLTGLQNENKEGKYHIVLVIDAEDWSDITFLEQLFSRLESLAWVSFSSSDEIFKAIIPTQTILGEKISGSIYRDVITKESTFKPWYEPEDKKSSVISQFLDTSDILSRNIQKMELAKTTYPERDFSYPYNLYEKAIRDFTLAIQGELIKNNNSKNLKLVNNLVERARKTVAGIYDLLIDIIKNKKIKIPGWKDNSTILPEEEKILAFNKLKTKLIFLPEKRVVPEKVTSFSIIKIEFRLPERQKDIDYNNVSVIFNINDGEEYYQTKSVLGFDGKMSASLGSAKTGDELKCYVYFKDKKGNSFISEPFSVSVE